MALEYLSSVLAPNIRTELITRRLIQALVANAVFRLSDGVQNSKASRHHIMVSLRDQTGSISALGLVVV